MSQIDYESVVEKLLTTSHEDIRWIDQKVTFDNLYLIARTVDLAIQADTRWFDRFDLAKSGSLQSTIVRDYGKPALDNVSAGNEYDKFLAQPLNTLAYAGVLDSKRKGKSRLYRVTNRPILQEIGASEDSARKFLIVYLRTVLKNLGFWPHLERYFMSGQTGEDFATLKKGFQAFMLENTKIGSRGSRNPETEINRIFPKVLNPLCYERGAFGTEKGRVMKTPPSKYDLIYNRPNFRDANSGKTKNLTRRQFADYNERKHKNESNRQSMSAAMKKVRDYQNRISEFDPFIGTPATHVHHIFPKSNFPQLAEVKENLIVLTPGQHYEDAHPNGNTQKVDLTNQRTYLFCKLNSVRKSVEAGDGFYSYKGMAKVIELGYGVTPRSEDFHGCHAAIVEILV